MKHDMAKVWAALESAKQLAGEQAESVLTNVGDKIAGDPDVTTTAIRSLTSSLAIAVLVEDPAVRRNIIGQIAGLLLVTLAVDEETRGEATTKRELEVTREANRKMADLLTPVGGDA